MPHQCTECGRTFADGSKEMLSGCPDCGGNKFQFQPSSAQSEARKSAAADSDTTNSGASAGDAPGAAASNADSDTTEPADERKRANVEREMPELGQDANETTSEPTGADQFDVGDDAEIDNTTAEEDRAQRDARSTPTTSEEIDEARRKMAEAEQERLAEVEAKGDSNEGRSTRGRGTPQGPPTDGPDEAAAEQFGLDGAVGGPDEQPSPNAANQRGSEADALEGPDTDLSALREELNDQFESIKITAPGQYELNLMELYDRKEYIISLQEDGRYVVDIPEGYEYRED